MDWIGDITAALATATGIDAATLSVDDPTRETLLDLAGVAAHTSGDRTNAPILCHVIGRALASGATLAQCEQVVRAFADPA